MAANTAGMTPEARRALLILLAKAEQAGIPAKLTSAFRSKEDQAVLYRRFLAGDPNSPLAAKPGQSRHERGESADVSVPSAYRKQFNALAEKEGFRWLGPKDAVHYDFVGSAPPVARVKSLADLPEPKAKATGGLSSLADLPEPARASVKSLADLPEPKAKPAPLSLGQKVFRGLGATTNARNAMVNTAAREGAKAPSILEDPLAHLRALPGAIGEIGRAGREGFSGTFQGRDVPFQPVTTNIDPAALNPNLYATLRTAEELGGIFAPDPSNPLYAKAFGLVAKGVKASVKPLATAISKEKANRAALEALAGTSERLHTRAGKVTRTAEKLGKRVTGAEERLAEKEAAKAEAARRAAAHKAATLVGEGQSEDLTKALRHQRGEVERLRAANAPLKEIRRAEKRLQQLVEKGRGQIGVAQTKANQMAREAEAAGGAATSAKELREVGNKLYADPVKIGKAKDTERLSRIQARRLEASAGRQMKELDALKARHEAASARLVASRQNAEVASERLDEAAFYTEGARVSARGLEKEAAAARKGAADASKELARARGVADQAGRRLKEARTPAEVRRAEQNAEAANIRLANADEALRAARKKVSDLGERARKASDEVPRAAEAQGRYGVSKSRAGATKGSAAVDVAALGRRVATAEQELNRTLAEIERYERRGAAAKAHLRNLEAGSVGVGERSQHRNQEIARGQEALAAQRRAARQKKFVAGLQEKAEKLKAEAGGVPLEPDANAARRLSAATRSAAAQKGALGAAGSRAETQMGKAARIQERAEIAGSEAAAGTLPEAKTAMERLARALVGAQEKAANTRVGRKASEIADTLGVSSRELASRKSFREYDVALGESTHRAGQVNREMADYTRGRMGRKRDTPFAAAEKAFAAENQGRSRVQSLVRDYVQGHHGEGFASKLTAEELAGLKQRAAEADIPFEKVEQFGNRILDHVRETKGVFKAAGGRPYELHETDLGKEFARKRTLRDYTENLFRREQAEEFGRTAKSAYSGSGIHSVREAYLERWINQAVKDPNQVRDVAGKVKPGWVQLPDNVRDLGRLAGKQVPKPLHDRLTGEVAKVNKVLTRLGQSLGDDTSDLAKSKLQQAADAAEKFTGIRKRLWLANAVTPARNILGNAIFAGIGLTREGLSSAALAKEMPKAALAIREMAKTGKLTPEAEELMKHSRALHETFVSALGGQGRRSAAQLSGVERAGVGVSDVLGTLYGGPEKTFKLAMYQALRKGGKSAEEAARAVDKYLFDYSDRSAAMEFLDRYGIAAFNVFPTRAAMVTLDTLIHRPDIVAKYDRLRRSLMEPGDEEAYNKLPEWEKGVGTFRVPGRKGEFVNLGRALGFTDALDIGRAAVGGDLGKAAKVALEAAPGATYSDVAETLNDLKDAATGVTPEATKERARKVHPGAPAERRAKDALTALLKSGVPVIGQAERVIAATEGRTTSDSLVARPQSVGEAVLQALTGVKTVKGESYQEAVAANSPERAKRAVAAGRLIQATVADLRSGKRRNRFNLSKVTDAAKLRKQAEQTQNYVRTLVLSGNPQPDRIVEGVELLMAIAARVAQIGREQGGR